MHHCCCLFHSSSHCLGISNADYAAGACWALALLQQAAVLRCSKRQQVEAAQHGVLTEQRAARHAAQVQHTSQA